jgi:hypothetical protein
VDAGIGQPGRLHRIGFSAASTARLGWRARVAAGTGCPSGALAVGVNPLPIGAVGNALAPATGEARYAGEDVRRAGAALAPDARAGVGVRILAVGIGGARARLRARLGAALPIPTADEPGSAEDVGEGAHAPFAAATGAGVGIGVDAVGVLLARRRLGGASGDARPRDDPSPNRGREHSENRAAAGAVRGDGARQSIEAFLVHGGPLVSSRVGLHDRGYTL